ncbi:class I SAM-dependent methyltransferase [Phenylobacterium sp.]|jgi:2-polyprenyl-6-hydroxyphenyl methylase/3-demethylubiquinone-9 3-methyltransferase|uniref:class I SAM-dependent methyltransferase n=1 Tax=Phenylobacterium sp. TaxID=1871053 RepID=UPI002F93A456
MTDLLSADNHFAFGENWKSFASTIDRDRIAKSDAGVRKLFDPSDLEGKRVIDIGCGSGLPALSLLRAGAAHVTCIDIDPNSVAATKTTLGRFAPADRWSAEVASVFELTGEFDVVHSWGVLHHTGDMWRAIDRAKSLVKPGGLLALALYEKSPFCGMWKVEKAIYSKSPALIQKAVAAAYNGLLWTYYKATGKSPPTPERGMDVQHDVHDWLGGYPYESCTLEELRRALPWTLVRHYHNPVKLGFFGTGCSQYVFKAD